MKELSYVSDGNLQELRNGLDGLFHDIRNGLGEEVLLNKKWKSLLNLKDKVEEEFSRRY